MRTLSGLQRGGMAGGVVVPSCIQGAGRAEAGIPQCWSGRHASRTWVNRATSGRSAEMPLGNGSREYVVEANALIARWVMLMLIAVAFEACFLMEHPGSTVVDYHPAMRAMSLLREMRLIATAPPPPPNLPPSTPVWESPGNLQPGSLGCSGVHACGPVWLLLGHCEHARSSASSSMTASRRSWVLSAPLP